ncbi:hypothetical protein DRQ29_07055 [bacterium]|nr:MAG: hypothetical protein DRQ29_07055 [bacterium]
MVVAERFGQDRSDLPFHRDRKLGAAQVLPRWDRLDHSLPHEQAIESFSPEAEDGARPRRDFRGDPDSNTRFEVAAHRVP